MKKLSIIFIFSGFLALNSIAQVNLWSQADESELIHRSNEDRWTTPSAYGLYKLDVELLRAELNSVPHESQLSSRNSYAVFQFPMPDGSYRTFNVVEYNMLETQLARKFSHIKTYTGFDAENGSKIHFNLTENQFFAAIREKGVTYYIDPYFKTTGTYFISYDTRDHHKDDFQFECGQHSVVEGEVVEDENTPLDEYDHDEVFRGERGDPISLRSYRLAVSGTFEFTTYHGGTVSGAIDGISTIVNRINSVYEREAAIRLVLVANNDQIIFTTADDDPFEDGNLGQMINQNQMTVDSRIGVQNYDIGHVFGRAGYQGLAQLGAVCNGGSKARGGSVANQPLGDSYVVNIICHEMGHQFNANHTMYHCHNVNESTAYEPGSGSTIMSYAGICSGIANIQADADDYFHANSLQAVIGYSRNGGGAACGIETDFGNTNPDPILNYPSNLMIPVNTPFRLTGSAVDAENSSTLTYSWDQYQNGSRNFQSDPWDIRQPIGNEPIFSVHAAFRQSNSVFSFIESCGKWGRLFIRAITYI